jgi:hypothetical protein
VFNIDGEQWALDLRQGSGSVSKGAPAEKPDLTLTISDENFVKLVMGKLNPQQVGRPMCMYLSGLQLVVCRVLNVHCDCHAGHGSSWSWASSTRSR